LGRLLGGALIVLFVIVSGVVVAYVREGAEDTTLEATTCSGGNATACADDNEVSFLDQVDDASPADLGDDTPGIISVLWLVTIVFLLTAGLLLIALAFIPLTAE
jgi:hypothetical protein